MLVITIVGAAVFGGLHVLRARDHDQAVRDYTQAITALHALALPPGTVSTDTVPGCTPVAAVVCATNPAEPAALAPQMEAMVKGHVLTLPCPSRVPSCPIHIEGFAGRFRIVVGIDRNRFQVTNGHPPKGAVPTGDPKRHYYYLGSHLFIVLGMSDPRL